MAQYGLTTDLGQRTSSGTLITERIQQAAIHDAEVVVMVQENNLKEFQPLLSSAIAAALEEIGLRAERHAKMLCPVDTGRLRNSITHVIDAGSKEVSIGTNVEYAPYIEFGTSRRKATPFLTPAASDHGDEYRDVLKKHLGA